LTEDKQEEVVQFKAPQCEDNSQSQKTRPTTYAWRVDLCKSEPHWTSWFDGLSSKFLSVSTSKLLVLAGVDRLDRDLTVGQMQGKFQMQILPQAGHAVHEDVPDKVSDVLSTFLVRNKFARPLEGFNRTSPAC
jgi:protein phosphatase methylesterase 1